MINSCSEGELWEHNTVPIALMEYLGYSEELAQKLQIAYLWRVEADYLPSVTPTDRAQIVIEYTEEMVRRVEGDIAR